MDMETLRQAIPYAATAVGAGVGVAVEAMAQHHVAPLRHRLSDEWGPVVDQHTPGRLVRLGGMLIGPLVAVGTLSGLANGVIWQPESTQTDIPPQLEVVVDHSGATALNTGTAANEIGKLTSLFATQTKLETNAFVAGNGYVKEVKIKDVSKDVPFGDAPLEQAMQSALDKASLNQSKTTTASHNSGVLVITNGNSMGAPSVVVSEARAANVPVFVVNVEAGQADQQTTANLKLVASQTGAKYWDANTHNFNPVAGEIKKTIVSEQVKNDHNSGDNKWPLKAFAGAVTVGAFGIVYKRRSSMTLGNEFK